MISSFRPLLIVCSILIASQTSIARAGFFDELASLFRAPPPPSPIVKPEASKPVVAVQKPVVSERPVIPADAVRTIPQDMNQELAPDQPTIQAEPREPAGPTQKDLNEMLWLAALQGNEGRIRGLIEQGANPTSGTSYGETPLHVAASRGHLKPIIYLANHGASVNARTKNGWTPLHHAARFGHFQAVKYLLHMGAIPHIRTVDKGRKSPMEMAVDNGYLDIAALFGYRPR